jgi:hypothetical protein
MQLIRVATFASLLAALAISVGCGGGSDVPSGTYEGTIKEVNADEKEIYVETSDHGTLELYFTDDTDLSQGGSAVDFTKLAEGLKVRVTVENSGGELIPKKVELVGLSLPQ